jgi:hypothetical protein
MRQDPDVSQIANLSHAVTPPQNRWPEGRLRKGSGRVGFGVELLRLFREGFIRVRGLQAWIRDKVLE